MEKFFNDFENFLSRKLKDGWIDFLKSKQFPVFKNFAEFLDSQDEFQNIHRKTQPHPPHEFAARQIGLPLMASLTHLGIHTDWWFPGDYYRSYEREVTDYPGEDVHARNFTLELLYRCGKIKLCRLEFSFPHLHGGFGFKNPRVKILEAYANDIKKHYPELADRLREVA